MSSEYFTPTALVRGVLARAADVNALFTAVSTGFELLPTAAKLAENRVTYYVPTGTGNALVVTMAPALGAYTAGLRLMLKLAATNTGAATVNVNGLGVKSIKRYDGSALEAGDLTSGQLAELAYDGTNFIFGAASAVWAAAAAAAVSAAAAAASAASVDAANIVLRTGDQSIAGAKTFSSAIVASAGITINGQTLSGLTAAGKAIAEAANAGAQRTALGLVIGTNVQAFDAELAAIAGLTSAADKGIYFTGAGAAALFDLTSVARTLLAQTTQALMRTTGLGLGTAAVEPIGTSGAALGLLNANKTDSGNNTLSGTNNFTGPLQINGTSIFASPINHRNSAYTFVLGDAGKTIYHSEATTAHVYTIPPNASVAFPVGTVINIRNKQASGVITLSITSDTLRWGADGTGSRSLAAGAAVSIQKMETTEWVLTGSGIS